MATYQNLGRIRGTTFSACVSVFATSCGQQAGHYDLTSGTRHIDCELSIAGISVEINNVARSTSKVDKFSKVTFNVDAFDMRQSRRIGIFEDTVERLLKCSGRK